MVSYNSLCRDIPPVSLYRSLEQKSKHTYTHINIHPGSLTAIYDLYLYLLQLWRRGGVRERRRRRRTGELKNAGKWGKRLRERDVENSRGERER